MAKQDSRRFVFEPNEALLLNPDLLEPDILRAAIADSGVAHTARSFGRLPGPSEAAVMLAELADAPCAFSPVAADRPIALYGAGDLGRLARDFCDAVGVDVAWVIDRNAATAPGIWPVRPVTPDAVPMAARRAMRVAVCVATSDYVPIERALHDMGFTDVVPFYDLAENFRHLHPLSNGWFALPFTASEQADTAAVLAAWDDDASRAHHLQFLAWRRLREEWVFADAPPLAGDTRFFIPEIVGLLRDDETFIDGGAYEGGITETFVRRTHGSFHQIVAIEPDGPNRARLEAAIGKMGDARIAVHGFALAERDGEAPFHEGLGYASQLSVTGQCRVQGRSLDSLGVSPTFIKLHLEGGELAALKGARHMLTTQRPLVAATVYHNADGLFETARWLMQSLPDYRFLFRLHSWCGTGAVIYAIPNERRA